MNPEEVPEALVEKAMAAAYAADPYRYSAQSSIDAQAGIRAAIVAVWEPIYRVGEDVGHGDGYQKAMSDHDM